MKKIIIFLIVFSGFVVSNQSVFALSKIIRGSILNNTTFYDFCSDPDYPETYNDPSCVQYRAELERLEKQNTNNSSGQTSGETGSNNNSGGVSASVVAKDFDFSKAFESSLIKIASGAENYRTSYEKVANETGVPWQLLAAIHYRENSFSLKNSVTHNKDGTISCQGLFGFYSRQNCNKFPPGSVSIDGLEEQLRFLVTVLINDYNSGALGSSSIDNEALMDLLFSYNGRYVYQNKKIVLNNCPELSGNNLPNNKFSAYVMSGYNDCFIHLMKPSKDTGVADTVDNIPGVMTIYQYLLSKK